MRFYFVIAVLLTSCAQYQIAPAPEPGSMVFQQVNVVPMTGDTILQNMTVVVRGERIAVIGPAAQVPIPAGAHVIDGRGRWLMPGLVDTHVHTVGPEAITNRLFLLGLTQGVTTAMDLNGGAMALQLRGKFAAGTELGPTLYVAGPLVQDSAMSFEQGQQLVQEYRETGYDLIKVYNQLSRPGYRGVMLKAWELGMPVVGHVVRSMDLEGVLGAGQRGIVHMEEYLYTYFGLRLSDTTHVAAEKLNPDAIAYLAMLTANAGTYIAPTLVTFERMLALIEDLDQAMHGPGTEYMGEVLMDALRRHGQGTYADRFTHPQQVQNFREALAFQRQLTRAFHEAGVPLLIGTDAPIAVTLPGYGLHRELRNLVDAGLSPLQALRAATRNAAEYIGRGDDFGTVEVGKRADLLLLDANPLSDVANAERITGVMARGRWLDSARIAEVLAGLRETGT